MLHDFFMIKIKLFIINNNDFLMMKVFTKLVTNRTIVHY